MPHTALKSWIWVVALGVTSGAFGLDPHMDRSLIPNSCSACHRGHGVSRSPMLPAPQIQVCLSCHDSQTRLDQVAREGQVVPGIQPTFLFSSLSQPFFHPMNDQAFSNREPGIVTCTSCHSAHRGLPPRTEGTLFSGVQKASPQNPNRFEYELCGDCHGGEGLTQSPLDISSLFSQHSRSYHPVKGPSPESSPSVIPSLSGREINCTDCHGNSDPSGPRGPHGSSVRFLLRSPYTTEDGSSESLQAYSLCYECHDREKVLDSPSFPLHRLHVVEERSACASCHNPHGSIKNPALIHFGEETLPGGASPSIQSGRLAFISDGPGSGTCYLTCHASDHSPKSYGGTVLDPFPELIRPTTIRRERELRQPEARTPPEQD